MNKEELLSKVKNYVSNILNNDLPDVYHYHNANHTYNVVKNAALLADESGLKEDERNALLIAAWFHDVGYIKSNDNHEKHSADMAQSYLEGLGVAEATIQKVKGLIKATELGVKPSGLLEGLIKDADMYAIAVDPEDYNFSQRLRKEWQQTKNRSYTDEEWYKLNYDFFAEFDYHTMEGKNLYEFNKVANVKAIRAKLKEFDVEVVKQKELNKDVKYGRGVETLYRTVCANHIDLSAIADRKANILLSINAIVISIVLGSLFSQLKESPLLIAPTLLIIAVCVVTIIFATVSTIPKVTAGKSSLDKIRSKESNLAFFGNFHKMDLKDYVWGMQEMRRDQEFLYDTLTRDVYFLGKVLNRKYNFLRIAYQVFMWGVIASVLFYAVILIANFSLFIS